MGDLGQISVDVLPLTDPGWDEFVRPHPDSTIFHLPVWSSIIADCYRFEAFVLVAKNGGEVVAGVPSIRVRSPFDGVRWVSLPFSDACPLLVRADQDTRAVVAALRKHVLSSGVRELEVRGILTEGEDVHSAQVGYQHRLRLPTDPKDLHPSKGHRYNRNLARRSGIEVVHGRTFDDVRTYYRLHILTRRRLGVPVQPLRFFDLIAERIVTQGLGFVSLAMLDGEALAAGVYFEHNGTLTAKYGASDPAHRSSGAGSLCDWEVMVAGAQNGFHTMDFGRTDSEAEGLRAYKSGWGADEQPLVYTQITRRARGAPRPHVGTLPRLIIRESPTWVCRVLGEAFYRWSA